MTEYDPRQLLEAGQLAEQRQQMADAMRIYAYVADRFPDTMESRVAREAYQRAAAVTNGSAIESRAGATLPFEPGLGAGRSTNPSPPRANAAAPIVASASGRAGPRARALPEFLTTPRRSFGVGAAVARINMAFGWLLVLLGLIAVVGGVAVLADPSLATQAGLPLPPLAVGGGAIGAGALVSLLGLNIVMLAQLVLANFDTAQSARLIAEAEYLDK